MQWHERLIDASARRPSGALGRFLFRNPISHRASFRLLMEELRPTPDDLYAEIGCGGGVLLDMALATVRQACAIDHSPDMVELCRTRNAAAIAAGRLEVSRGAAEDLPWEDAGFTCITNANMFFFVERPLEMLGECRRVLAPGGRLVMVSAAPCLAMEPFRRFYRLRLYRAEAMRAMLIEAGLAEVMVRERWGHQICRAVRK